MNSMPTLPTVVYIFFGFMILANIGSIITCLFAAGRVIWWASKTDSRIEILENDAEAQDEKIDRVDRDLRQLILTPTRRS